MRCLQSSGLEGETKRKHGRSMYCPECILFSVADKAVMCSLSSYGVLPSVVHNGTRWNSEGEIIHCKLKFMCFV